MNLSRLMLIVPFLAVAACDQLGMGKQITPRPKPVAVADNAAGNALGRPAAKSAAQLDTTTATDKAAAAAPAAVGQKLGTTVASLGDATQAGFWIKTPLVKTAAKGRIVNPANGKSANVDLLPLGGAATAGSQVSLPALQMLGVSLTDLPEIEVWKA